jgi:predicted  nucleic acid-binding Zn-ribbon protein
MNPYIETMQQLQRRLQSGTKAGVEKLRGQVPAPVLDHFDRLLAQGRKGVAEVNHGVCGGCHLRLPAAVVVPSAEHEDLEICENCGAYLIFPTAEAVPVEPPVVRKRRRRTVALV